MIEDLTVSYLNIIISLAEFILLISPRDFLDKF